MNTTEQYKQNKHPLDVIDDVYDYADDGLTFEEIEERAGGGEWERLKWAGMYAQKQDGYFMIRTKVPGGKLTPEQAEVIGEVTEGLAVAPEKYGGEEQNELWGDAYLDITTRQDIQKHWIRVEDVPEMWDRYDEVGLTTVQGCGDSARNVLGCPAAGLDDHECFNAQPVIEAVSDFFTNNREYANLPRKFKMTITGCKHDCAQSQINDIGLVPAKKEIDVSGEAGGSSDESDGGEEVRGFNVRIGGGLGGRQPRAATPLDVFVRPENAYGVGRAFVELYHEEGGRTNRSKNRGRFFAEDWGMEKIRETMQEEYVDFEMHTAGEDFRDEYTYNAGKPTDEGKHDHVGVYDQKQEGLNYVGLSVPVGRLPAEDAIELADLADAYGSGEVRLTRRQNSIITDVQDDDLEDLLAEPVLEEYPPEPSPFERGAMACTGTEFCSIALTETKARMARMLRWFNRNVELPDDVGKIKMHYSGCTADCGQAMTADIGLQGMRARKDGEMVEAFDIGVGGGVGENPSFVEWIRQRVPADEAPGAIRNLLQAFAAHREDGQTFRQWVEATGEEQLIEFCEPEETDFEAPYMADAKQSWYPFAETDSVSAAMAKNSVATSDD